MVSKRQSIIVLADDDATQDQQHSTRSTRLPLFAINHYQALLFLIMSNTIFSVAQQLIVASGMPTPTIPNDNQIQQAVQGPNRGLEIRSFLKQQQVYYAVLLGNIVECFNDPNLSLTFPFLRAVQAPIQANHDALVAIIIKLDNARHHNYLADGMESVHYQGVRHWRMFLPVVEILTCRRIISSRRTIGARTTFSHFCR